MVTKQLNNKINNTLNELGIPVKLYPYEQFFELYKSKVRKGATSVKSIYGHVRVGINEHPIEKESRVIAKKLNIDFNKIFIIDCIIEALHEFMHKKFKDDFHCEDVNCIFFQDKVINVVDSKFIYKKPCKKHQFQEATNAYEYIEELLKE